MVGIHICARVDDLQWWMYSIPPFHTALWRTSVTDTRLVWFVPIPNTVACAGRSCMHSYQITICFAWFHEVFLCSAQVWGSALNVTCTMGCRDGAQHLQIYRCFVGKPCVPLVSRTNDALRFPHLMQVHFMKVWRSTQFRVFVQFFTQWQRKGGVLPSRTHTVGYMVGLQFTSLPTKQVIRLFHLMWFMTFWSVHATCVLCC